MNTLHDLPAPDDSYYHSDGKTTVPVAVLDIKPNRT